MMDECVELAKTLGISDRAYVMETGRIVLTGTGNELLHNDRVIEFFLGGK